jgi:lipopolysaccharide export system protein LptA
LKPFIEPLKNKKKIFLTFLPLILSLYCDSLMVLKPQKVVLPQNANNPEEAAVRPVFPEIEISENKDISSVMPGSQVILHPEPELHKNTLPISEEYPEKSVKSQKEKKENDENEIGNDSSLPVIYTGNELTRSRFKVDGKSIEELLTVIKGKAVVKQGKMQMKSHEIKMFGEQNDVAESVYPLIINDFKSNTEITSGYGRFTKKDNMAYLTKKPFLKHVDLKTGEKTTIKGDKMFHNFSSGISIVYGNVVIENIKAISYGMKATYYKDDDRIELEGNPRIYEKNNIYKSDKMRLDRRNKIAYLFGHSQVISLEKTDEKLTEKAPEDKRTVETLILSDNAEHHYGNKPEITIFSTERTNGFVYISRKDSDTYCRKAIARGTSPDEIDLFEDVYILDRDNRTRLYGEYSEYRKEEDKVWVYTRNNNKGIKIIPEVFFYNKEDELTGQMKGEIFERHLEKKITYARGDINFKLYEKKNSPQDPDTVKNEILGQWAEVEDSKKEVYIYGKPYLKQKDRNIYAGKIIVYPDENRLDLHHSIEGNL